MTTIRHFLPGELLKRRVSVLVVGAGGTGSHVVANLAVLHQSMVDLGHPGGLKVTVADDDIVSSANVGRSCFFECDVGLNKAAVAVQRVNMCYGLDFEAEPRRLTGERIGAADITVGCVDTRSSRRAIRRSLNPLGYWLDIGNDEDDGQCILGQGNATWMAHDERRRRLPCVTDLYPEIMNPRKDPRDPGPSCSRAEALRRQSTFVNKQAALHAATLLSALFRNGWLDHHAIFFSVRTGRASVLHCDRDAWARFGYHMQQGQTEEEAAAA